MPVPAAGAWRGSRGGRNHGGLVHGPGSGLGHDHTARRGDRRRGRFGLGRLCFRPGRHRGGLGSLLFDSRRWLGFRFRRSRGSLDRGQAQRSGAGGGATGAGEAASIGGGWRSYWNRCRRRGHSRRRSRRNRRGRVGRRSRRCGPGRSFNRPRMRRMGRGRRLDHRNSLRRHNRDSGARGAAAPAGALATTGAAGGLEAIAGGAGGGETIGGAWRTGGIILRGSGRAGAAGGWRYRHHWRSRAWLRPAVAGGVAGSAGAWLRRAAALPPASWPESPSAHRPAWRCARGRPSAVCPAVPAMTQLAGVQPAGWALCPNCVRTRSASSPSSELEWVLASVTPTSGRMSRIARGS